MKKYKIIIAENDDDEQFFMKQGFDATGLFEIMAQPKNGDVLLSWLQEHQSTLPDVILSDLNMPGKNGYDIIEAVTDNPALKNIPVIITSTSSTPSIINKCIDKGASDYIIKPETFIDYEPFARNLYRKIDEKQLLK